MHVWSSAFRLNLYILVICFSLSLASTALIVGIVVGVIVFLAIIGCIVGVVMYRKRTSAAGTTIAMTTTTASAFNTTQP